MLHSHFHGHCFHACSEVWLLLLQIYIERTSLIWENKCAALRRYEAAGWLRRMVGVVGGRDLASEPSEEEFRLGLRSGIVLCNALNKVQPGAVSKV